MSNETTFEPTSREKLSSKFIFDALKQRSQVQEPLPEPVSEAAAQMSVAQAEQKVTAQACSTPVQETLPSVDELAPVCETSETEPDFSGRLPAGKKYFRIGEVSEIVGVEAYVLRYWESEFKIVRPVKSRSGQRVYLRKDVESLLYIRHLLHFEKFSIKGAKKRIQEKRREKAELGTQAPRAMRRETLKQYTMEVRELMKMIRQDPGL